VCPSLPLAVYATTPMPDPCTVIDADPESAWFNRRILLKDTVSADHPWLVVPPRPPTVITTRRVPTAPCPIRHRTDVSDSQLVPSHPVGPWRVLTVRRVRPMPAP
jgi:hypothetical protein